MSKVKIFTKAAHELDALTKEINEFMESVIVKDVRTATVKSNSSDHRAVITVFYEEKQPEKKAGFRLGEE